jgi:hypothetical protein
MAHLDRKTIEALSVFTGVSFVQYVVPYPLDSLLLPGAVTFWWISSNQSHWLIDQMSDRTSKVVDSAVEYFKKVTEKKEDDQTPK